jgi:hypothetical protein
MSAREPAALNDTFAIREKIDEANNGAIANVSDELRCLAALLTAASGSDDEACIRLCDVGQMVASLQDRLQGAKDEIERALAELGAAEHERARSAPALRVVPPSCDSTA